MLLTTLMIIITLFKGKETLDTSLMLNMDLFLTVAILLDVVFRIKMLGAKTYFSHKWNILEVGISICCAVTFTLLILRKINTLTFSKHH